MRTIKFRAWDKEIKEMLSDVSLWNDDFTSYLNEHIEYLQDKCELMQYTGLKDKNGVWIYEGDIVIHKGEYLSLKKPAFVIFENGRFVMDCGDSVTHRLYKWSDNWSIEVIGNIYENPELLETKELNGQS